MRPVELALPTAQHVDAITHALGVMKNDGIEPDILVVLLANSGIIKTEWIEESIQNLLKNPDLSASCPVMLEMDNHPYRSKCLREDGCLGTFMGNNIKPIIVKESFDVHDEDDIIRTEKWLREEAISYES